MNEYEIQSRIEQLFAEIYGGRIKDIARRDGDQSSWSRRRKMPLQDLVMCTLAKKGLSTTMEVRQYFQAMEKAEKTVSKQDYLRQRQKLNPNVFKVLNRNYLKRFYEGKDWKDWHGYLVMAADGSGAEIPNSEENRKAYGESITKYGPGVARADLSVLHDVYNRFILDIGMHHNSGSEIEEAKCHIDALKEIIGDRPVLVMFDRNYVGLEFMDFLEKKGVNYLIRLRKGDYKAELAMMQGMDEEVEIVHTGRRLNNIQQKSAERAREIGQRRSTLVRVLKAVLDNGEETSFVTNMREGSGEEITRLYRKRWSIEQKYHTLKNKLKFESVTGKASIYVEQDFWAQTLVFNIVQDLIGAAEWKAANKGKMKGLKYEVRINENIAIGLFKEKFIRLIMEADAGRKEEMYRRLIADMERNIVPVRKLKSAPRKWKYFNKYKCNQKPSF